MESRHTETILAVRVRSPRFTNGGASCFVLVLVFSPRGLGFNTQDSCRRPESSGIHEGRQLATETSHKARILKGQHSQCNKRLETKNQKNKKQTNKQKKKTTSTDTERLYRSLYRSSLSRLWRKVSSENLLYEIF